MGDFSVQAGSLGHGDSTKKIFWNSLHAVKGIGKGEGFGIIHICYKNHKNYLQWMSSLCGLVVTSLDCHTGDPGSIPRWCTFSFIIFFIAVNQHDTLDSIFCIIRLNYNVSLMLDILINLNNLKNNILVQKISNFEWKKFASDRDRTRNLQIQMPVHCS